MGAVAITNVRHMGQASGVRGRVVSATVTMSASYAAGGDTVDPGDFNFSRVEGMAAISALSGFKLRDRTVTTPVGGFSARIGGTVTAPKILLFEGGPSEAEETAAVDVSDVTFDAFFYGR